MRKPLRNVGASVRARLLNLAKERNQPLDLLLTRYVLEGLLSRLSRSKHRSRFVLKGAILMTTWLDDPHRPTRDLDFLGFGDPDPQAMIAVFREICAIEDDDAVLFDTDGLTVDLARSGQLYGGLRLKTVATVDGARVRVVVDIGFGDTVVPDVREIELPALLDRPAPRLRAYPRETVIAEKFQAMVVLGRANSRMKDFYDPEARLHVQRRYIGARHCRHLRATGGGNSDGARRRTEPRLRRGSAQTAAMGGILGRGRSQAVRLSPRHR
jgi:hypothetical protein